MNIDIKNVIKPALYALKFQQSQPKDQVIPHEVPGKL